MEPLSVALLQSDARVAQSLAASLSKYFHSVHVARTIEDLQTVIVKHRSEVVVLDVEAVRLSEVERLRRRFPAVCIVCTHRLADEEMWTAALNAGASDVCTSSDTKAILLAALRSAAMAHSAAA